MEWTPEWLVGIGMLGIAALYLPMLRRERPVVAATPEGLVVGERTLPWRAVQRLGLAAGDGGAELRIATTHGVVPSSLKIWIRLRESRAQVTPCPGTRVPPR
jgi:hypothetical protein